MTTLRNIRFVRWLKSLMIRNMHNMISCEEFEGFIFDYIDDQLSPKVKSVFEFHLKRCKECREFLEAYKRSIEISRAIYDEKSGTLSYEVPEELIKAILDARDCQ